MACAFPIVSDTQLQQNDLAQLGQCSLELVLNRANPVSLLVLLKIGYICERDFFFKSIFEIISLST